MAVTVHAINTIVSDPAIRDGSPIIAGTTIRVSDIAAYYVYAGRTPEELAVGFALDLGQVHATLAYYHMHKAEVDAELRQNADAAEDYMAELSKQGRLIRD